MRALCGYPRRAGEKREWIRNVREELQLGHLVMSDQPMGVLPGISSDWALGHAQIGAEFPSRHCWRAQACASGGLSVHGPTHPRSLLDGPGTADCRAGHNNFLCHQPAKLQSRVHQITCGVWPRRPHDHWTAAHRRCPCLDGCVALSSHVGSRCIGSETPYNPT